MSRRQRLPLTRLAQARRELIALDLIAYDPPLYQVLSLPEAVPLEPGGAVMIDYATRCAIRDGAAEHLTPTQLADGLGLDVKTVRHGIDRPYAPRARIQRTSKLDPFKGRIVGWLEVHPLTAQQVFQRLGEGGISIVKDYVRTIRPRPRAAFLTLAFAPGEVAQVDWDEFGTIAVDHIRRRLSCFVMVLAYSRQLYVEFTLAQTMEHFLTAHVNAFHALGVPKKVMVDKLRSAVLRHARGEPVQFNPRYLDFARHYGFVLPSRAASPKATRKDASSAVSATSSTAS